MQVMINLVSNATKFSKRDGEIFIDVVIKPRHYK